MCAGSAHFGLADSLSEALEGIYAGSAHFGLADSSSEALEGIYAGSAHFGIADSSSEALEGIYAGSAHLGLTDSSSEALEGERDVFLPWMRLSMLWCTGIKSVCPLLMSYVVSLLVMLLSSPLLLKTVAMSILGKYLPRWALTTSS